MSMPKSARVAALALSAAGALALGSCETATPYQPASSPGSYHMGYSDQRLDDTHFRVGFSGNSLTARETVERYLLYRAAELTVQSGFDYFVLVSRDTETKSSTYLEPGLNRGPWGYWRPYWRWYRPRFGWRSWDPFFGDPFMDNDFDVRTIQRYEATAEIAVGHGAKPTTEVRAFDAHEVLSRLGPSIQTPEERRNEHSSASPPGGGPVTKSPDLPPKG
ncbi:MAG: hypothetical protein WDN44_04060 [Sphingomonas sp.]